MINNILKWSGVFFICLGATLVTFDIQPYNVISLNLGTLFYTIYAIRTKDAALLVLNLFLFSIYGAGVLMRI